MNVIDLIVACAKVPSFSTFEERLHPLILEIASQVPQAEVIAVPDNNLVIKVPGKRQGPAIALTAHLDKINHFSKDHLDDLPVSVENGRIIGQMDDTAGLGICLDLLLKSRDHNFPTLYILLSEMEEGMGLRKHPEWMKNEGKDVKAGIGAQRISTYLKENKELPGAVITFDTTPKFKGEPGICLYDCFWHRDENFEASEELKIKQEGLKLYFQGLNSNLVFGNAVNDYLDYGLSLNTDTNLAIPSIAIEPAIYPYHQKDEGVYCSDIELIIEMMVSFLTTFSFSKLAVES